jgi:hypothetical protein
MAHFPTSVTREAPDVFSRKRETADINGPILGFSDRQLAILKTASAPLSKDERSRFLRAVARRLGNVMRPRDGEVESAAAVVLGAMLATVRQDLVDAGNDPFERSKVAGANIEDPDPADCEAGEPQ